MALRSSVSSSGHNIGGSPYSDAAAHGQGYYGKRSSLLAVQGCLWRWCSNGCLRCQSDVGKSAHLGMIRARHHHPFFSNQFFLLFVVTRRLFQTSILGFHGAMLLWPTAWTLRCLSRVAAAASELSAPVPGLCAGGFRCLTARNCALDRGVEEPHSPSRSQPSNIICTQ